MAPRRNRRSAEQLEELQRSSMNTPVREMEEQRETLLMDQLVTRLERLQTVKRTEFKPPVYEGQTDVELFITQFQDVAVANDWSATEALLHLRNCLRGDAVECGREVSLADTFQSLRARFGLTPKQARERLQTLQKKNKQSFHELGSEINKLVQVAYPEQTMAFKTQNMLETYNRAVGLRSLRQHLLARPHDSLAEAIAISNEFMSLEGPRPTLNQTVTEEDNSTAQALREVTILLHKMMHTQSQLTEELMRNSCKPNSPPEQPPTSGYTHRTTPTKPGPCFQCGGDHWKRNCPLLARSNPNSQPTSSANQQPGNCQGLAQ